MPDLHYATIEAVDLAREDGYLYDIVFDGETIIHRDRLPEHNAARVLVARGLKGKLVFLDAKTGKERLIFDDIETAAKWTVLENKNQGPRLVRWKPFPATRRRAGEVFPTLPVPEAGKAKEGPQ
jgi:hypothetical protein